MPSSLPTSMKAAHKLGSGPLSKSLHVDTNHPLPKNANTLPPKHALVKVAYCALNPVDSKICDAPLIGRLAFGTRGIPCFDYAGTVVTSASPDFKEGQAVFGQTCIPNFGACAEYLVVDAQQACFPVPEGVKLEDAATIGVAGITADQSIVPFLTNKGNGVKAAECSVLINGGSGGVGTYAIQIAKALDINCHVTATCSGPNVELCKTLGADEVIDYRSQSVVETLKKRGKQFDLVLDNVFADKKLYWSCHEYLKPDGNYVTIAGGPSLRFIADYLSVLLWPGFLGGGKRRFKFVAGAPSAQDYARIATWVRDGVVKPVIEKVYEMEDVRKAFERLNTGRTRGKLVVRVS